MSPEHAQSVKNLLADQLAVYEKLFGPIRQQPEGSHQAADVVIDED